MLIQKFEHRTSPKWLNLFQRAKILTPICQNRSFIVGQEGLAIVGSVGINNCTLKQNIKAQLGWNSQNHYRKLGVIDWCDRNEYSQLKQVNKVWCVSSTQNAYGV